MSNDSPDLIFEDATYKPDRCPECGETEIIESDGVWRCPGCDAALAEVPLNPPSLMTSDEPRGESRRSTDSLDLPVAANVKETVVAGNSGQYAERLEPHLTKFGVKNLDSDDDLTPVRCAEDALAEKERQVTSMILEAEQRGIVSAGQAQKINDLRDELSSESSQSSSQSVEDAIKEARKQAELHTLLQDQYRTEEARDERIEHLRDELDSESEQADSTEKVDEEVDA
jgi:hypothetical protein